MDRGALLYKSPNSFSKNGHVIVIAIFFGTTFPLWWMGIVGLTEFITTSSFTSFLLGIISIVFLFPFLLIFGYVFVRSIKVYDTGVYLREAHFLKYLKGKYIPHEEIVEVHVTRDSKGTSFKHGKYLEITNFEDKIYKAKGKDYEELQKAYNLIMQYKRRFYRE